MSKKKTTNIKSASIIEFFNQHSLSGKIKEDQWGDSTNKTWLMKDTIKLRGYPFDLGDELVFHLDYDAGINSDTLRYKYTYEVEVYDDINSKLVLVDYKVEVIKGRDLATKSE